MATTTSPTSITDPNQSTKGKIIMFNSKSDNPSQDNNCESQTHVKFDSLPTTDKKEKKTPQRRRTPYAWDDQLKPVFDADKKEKEQISSYHSLVIFF